MGISLYCGKCQFNNEHLPVALLSGALWLPPLLTAPAELPRWRLAFAGLLLGLGPFAKLQATPIAALLVVAAGGLRWRGGGDRSRGFKQCLWLAGGAILPAAVLTGIAVASGTVSRTYTGYFLNNLDYIKEHELTLLHSLSNLIP